MKFIKFSDLFLNLSARTHGFLNFDFFAALFQLTHPAHLSDISEIEKSLGADLDHGLTHVESKRRLEIYGANELEGGGPVRS